MSHARTERSKPLIMLHDAHTIRCFVHFDQVLHRLHRNHQAQKYLTRRQSIRHRQQQSKPMDSASGRPYLSGLCTQYLYWVYCALALRW